MYIDFKENHHFIINFLSSWTNEFFLSCFFYPMYVNRRLHLMECWGSKFQMLMYRFLVIVYLCFCHNIQPMSCCQSQARFGCLPFFVSHFFYSRDLYTCVEWGCSLTLVYVANVGCGLGCYFTSKTSFSYPLWAGLWYLFLT